MSSRRDVLTQFLEQNRPRIVGWLRSENVEPEDIDDLVQEVGRRAFKYEHAFDPSRAPGAWLWRITKNVAADHHDRRAAQREVKDDAALEREAAPSNPELDYMDRQIDHIVREIVADLPADRRALIEARFIDNLSVQEIAAAFGIPLSTVKDRLAGTLKVCRRALARKGVDESRGALVLPLVAESMRQGGGKAREGIAGKIAAASVFSAAAAAIIVYLLMRGAAGMSPVAVDLKIGMGGPFSAQASIITTRATRIPREAQPAPVCPAPPKATPPPCPAPPLIDASARHRARLATIQAEEALFDDAAKTIAPPPKNDTRGLLFAGEVRERYLAAPQR